MYLISSLSIYVEKDLRRPYVKKPPWYCPAQGCMHRYPQKSPSKPPMILGILSLISPEMGSDVKYADVLAIA